MTQEHPDVSSAASPRYEARDADARRLVQLGLSLCLVIVVALFGVAKLMAYWATRQPQGQPVSPLATTADLPPKPRLQIEPRLDLARKRTADDAALNSYAWIDRTDGTVRIPIERAMELLAERLRAPGDLATTGKQKPAAKRGTPRAKEQR